MGDLRCDGISNDDPKLLLSKGQKGLLLGILPRLHPPQTPAYQVSLSQTKLEVLSKQ